MTLRDITIKNFRYNMKKYLAYFLCSSFAVTILFMYATLFYNDSILAYIVETPLYQTMKMALIGLGVFCFIFISYANSSFIRGRNSEFGLFLILGMSKKEIEKTIRIENGLISILSITAGLISGTILSRLFFMVGMKILDVHHMTYQLNYKSYLLTLVLFLAINAIMFLVRKNYMRKLELTELIKDARKSRQGKAYPLVGLIGVLSMIASYVLLYLILEGKIHGNIIVYVAIVMCFLGLYLTIVHYGGILIYAGKKKYFKDILSLTSIRYRFSDYRKVLYVVALLSTGAILFISLVYSLYIQTKTMVNKYNPYDIEYMEMADMDNLSKEELYTIIQQDETHLSEAKTLEVVQTNMYKLYDGEYSLWDDKTAIISETNVNKHLPYNLQIKEGHVVSLRNKKETDYWNAPGETIILQEENNAMYTYTVQDEIYHVLANEKFSRIFDVHFAIIMNDQDYTKLVENEGLLESTIHLFKFKNAKQVVKIYKDMVKAETGEEPDDNYIKAKYDRYLKVSSRVIEYKASISEYGFELFIMGFIGLIFFITSGVVLYFKIYSDMDGAKQKFKMLYKVGITDDEIKRTISKELKPLFFIPIILGSLIGLGYIVILFVNIAFYAGLIKDTIIIIMVYLFFQSIFYGITKKKYYEEMISA